MNCQQCKWFKVQTVSIFGLFKSECRWGTCHVSTPKTEYSFGGNVFPYVYKNDFCPQFERGLVKTEGME